MKLYIAGLFDDRERLIPMRDRLVSYGHEVTSSWLTQEPIGKLESSNPTGQSGGTLAQAAEYGRRDLEEIDAGDGLILDTISVTPRGGREWEGGYAQGHGKAIWIVGPVRNVFHARFSRFDTWEEALTYFREING